MATTLISKVKCSRCLGTGLDDNDKLNPPVPCVSCNATGYVGTESTDFTVITDKLDEIMAKCNTIESDTNKIWAKVKNL